MIAFTVDLIEAELRGDEFPIIYILNPIEGSSYSHRAPCLSSIGAGRRAPVVLPRPLTTVQASMLFLRCGEWGKLPFAILLHSSYTDDDRQAMNGMQFAV